MCNIKVSHLSILLGLKDESNKCLSLRVKRASYTYQMCFFFVFDINPNPLFKCCHKSCKRCSMNEDSGLYRDIVLLSHDHSVIKIFKV